MTTRVAVIQAPPVLLDLEASLERAILAVDEAAAAGASLMVFPEAYLPGYPTWIWRLRPGPDMALSGELHARLRANALDLSRDELRPLQEAAQRNAVTVVMGLHERDGQ